MGLTLLGKQRKCCADTKFYKYTEPGQLKAGKGPGGFCVHSERLNKLNKD